MPACLIDAPQKTPTIPIDVVTPVEFATWLGLQEPATLAWVISSNFVGKAGQTLLYPGVDGKIQGGVYVLGSDHGRGGLWRWTALHSALPTTGIYRLQGTLSSNDVNEACLGFALAAYRYDQFRAEFDETYTGPHLVWPDGTDQDYVRAAYGATKMVRDLINAPASHMGPAELATAAQSLADASGAEYNVIVGTDLIREGYPAVYAVGRGAEHNRAPRLVEFTWGRADAPKVTLVGKGVCFDSGGLDIKPASGMKIMKKDMGGAAHALGLASMIMALDMDVRLKVIIPAVENSVSAAAMRPLDVVPSRKGLSIEIGHTDAEGRVILADALTRACEDSPDVIIDFATLTGAARVALGTDLPALFSNNDPWAAELMIAGKQTADPVWHMPLWQPYEPKIHGKVADLRNDSDSPYAGAILAGLFLESFVDAEIPWIHVDLMGWNLSASPGRPEGGEAMSMRAIFSGLKNRFGK